MTVTTWPGAELASARSIEHVVRRQAQACALAALVTVAWRLGPLPGPQRLLGYVVLGLALTLMAELLVGAMQRDRAERCADDLIESGFPVEGRTDPVSRAVRARIREVVSERHRRRVANALRWQLELEARPASLVLARNGALLPPCGFGAHAERIVRIADAIERAPCDPRALIRISRLLSTPDRPRVSGSAAVGAALRRVEGVLGESTQLGSETVPEPNSADHPDYPGARSTSVHRDTGRRF